MGKLFLQTKNAIRYAEMDTHEDGYKVIFSEGSYLFPVYFADYEAAISAMSEWIDEVDRWHRTNST